MTTCKFFTNDFQPIQGKPNSFKCGSFQVTAETVEEAYAQAQAMVAAPKRIWSWYEEQVGRHPSWADES